VQSEREKWLFIALFMNPFRPIRSLLQKDIENPREKGSQNVYELMLKHIFQIQAGLKKVASKPR